MLDPGPTPSHTRNTSYQGSSRQPEELEAIEKDTPRSRERHDSREQLRPQWIAKGYYDVNPWYNQKKAKPNFSLGQPLPRMVRWDKSTSHEDGVKPNDDLAELGGVSSGQTSESGSEASLRKKGKHHRQTPAGVTLGGRFNDAGQPVHEYIPSNNQLETQADSGAEKQKIDGPDFGIDSEPLGKREKDEAEKPNSNLDDYRNWWARFRAKHPEPLAEFLATFAAVFLGLAGNLSVYLSANQAEKYGTYETSCWTWGFAWMFGIYLGGGVSGAHMNPAISISLSIFRGFPWRQCSVYVIAQFIASFVAAALAYGVYQDAIHFADPRMESTAKALFSSPNISVSLGTACFSQMVGSAVMMVAVFALGDDQNNPPGAGMHALILGLLVSTLRFSLGYNIGSSFNPASDFGPRVIAYAFGYREATVFSTGWWIYGPWLSTLAGSLIGCSIYDSFIFVGSESPINYRAPEKYRKRAKRMVNLDK
ncbi:aquaporin-like protein [Xylaria bambusicola]|uniref:aquaporin-like protein n=1 Tax=Xylaria bambusicola TaxID=326684 RepID=UPI0020076505|nr:aquaporin-like protein [Xylaria bambusicola]KAI0515063.1 aquaporin-like protein [Xylaria bambusicola]